jgi:sulfatase maturation enzyme AslB (radical SAM superfamily)
MRLDNNNPDCAIVTLFTHNVCNYNCSYCSDYHRDGSYRWSDNWTPWINFIKEVEKRNKYVYVEILGGEPTLQPKFSDFIDTISDDNTFIEFSTNASRTIRYWENFHTKKNCFIFLSWHSEEADDDHFYRVAEVLHERTTINVPLMVTPENFERAKKLHNRLKQLKVSVIPRLTRQNIDKPGLMNFNQEQKDWAINARHIGQKPFDIEWDIPRKIFVDGYKKHWAEIQANDQHKFSGWKCMAGLKRLFVDKTGDIYRCTQTVGGKIGNIFGEYEMPEKEIICNVTYCPCKLDAIIEKWKEPIRA